MAFEIGDYVVADKSGRRARSGSAGLRNRRHGVIEEVLRGDPRPRYRIRWDTGQRSDFSPLSGLQLDPSRTKA